MRKKRSFVILFLGLIDGSQGSLGSCSSSKVILIWLFLAYQPCDHFPSLFRVSLSSQVSFVHSLTTFLYCPYWILINIIRLNMSSLSLWMCWVLNQVVNSPVSQAWKQNSCTLCTISPISCLTGPNFNVWMYIQSNVKFLLLLFVSWWFLVTILVYFCKQVLLISGLIMIKI